MYHKSEVNIDDHDNPVSFLLSLCPYRQFHAVLMHNAFLSLCYIKVRGGVTICHLSNQIFSFVQKCTKSYLHNWHDVMSMSVFPSRLATVVRSNSYKFVMSYLFVFNVKSFKVIGGISICKLFYVCWETDKSQSHRFGLVMRINLYPYSLVT